LLSRAGRCDIQPHLRFNGYWRNNLLPSFSRTKAIALGCTLHGRLPETASRATKDIIGLLKKEWIIMKERAMHLLNRLVNISLDESSILLIQSKTDDL
jgi:hypothetical protein